MAIKSVHFYALAGILVFSKMTQIAESVDQSARNCREADTCSECTALSSQCKWCEDFNFPKEKPRCQSHFLPSECKSRIDPSIRKDITKDFPFSDKLSQPIQLKPQQIKIFARPGVSTHVNLSYKQAADYPMDLYYLMDMSYTMLQYKRNVSLIGNILAQKMQKTTRDFRIGFGTFVDKEAIPFANFNRSVRIVKNKRENVEVLYAHSFINHLKLSSNAKEFESRVQGAKVSGNLDSPEGTLDALMQVMVCDKEIGWRPQSDKIIVVATDEEFHYAGDGKLGGIIIPNDGQCHVENGRYIASTIYDYPSMHHIAEVAQKRKFNIVFSVANDVTQYYRVLTDIIGPNARVAQLTVNRITSPREQDSNSIASMIEEVYKNISTSVELVIEDKPDNVHLEIWSNCGQEGDQQRQTSICGFQGKAVIPFNIRLRLLNCTKVGKNVDHKIRIGLLNKNEAIEIDFQEYCQCPCERMGQLNSPKCSHNGTFSCGICTKCNGRRSGSECECDPDKPIDWKNPNAHCQKAGDARPCSGHGNCECGKCKCEHPWAGEYCDVDESGCFEIIEGHPIKCNDQGDCVNNRCVCNDRYDGKFCGCIKNTATCMKEGQLCSGRGTCRCGRCDCSKQFTAHGRFCEKCPFCEAPQFCEQILSCIANFTKKFCIEPKTAALNGSVIETTEMDNSASFSRLQLDPNRTNPCTIDPEECLVILENWNYQIVDEIVDPKPAFTDDESKEYSESSITPLFDSQHFFNFPCQKVINGCDVTYRFRLVYDRDSAEMGTVDLSEPSSEFEKLEKPEMLNFQISKYKEVCPQPVNMVVVGSSAFFTVLLIGIVTIIVWKILTEYLDRREYQRFMMEIDEANFTQMENPLYKDVKVQFRNPAFGLRDRTSRFFNNFIK